MGIENEIKKLTQFYPVLGELPASVQYNLMVSGKPVSAVTGEILFDVGVAIQTFMLLYEGSIRIIGTSRERELVLYRVQPGESCVISICHLLGDTRYRARAEVEAPIRGVALPQPLFWDMVEQSPAFSYFIMQSFSDRFTQLLGLVERVTSMQLDQRLARLLISRGTPIYATHVSWRTSWDREGSN